MAQLRVNPLDDALLLDTWERTLSLVRPWRELALLSAACGETPEWLARLPIGERDGLLLQVREQTFGQHLDCETACPECFERLELALEVSQIRLPDRVVDAADLHLAVGNRTLTFRLPDSSDIAACYGTLGDAEQMLADRCIVAVTGDGSSPQGESLPPHIRDLVASRMAVLDPLADVTLDLVCPRCGHQWNVGFDPAGFLLKEIDAYAMRLVCEIHQIARSYGWSEEQILALGSARRRRYLELTLQ